jgi:cytoskeletal protein CcmA (bactofilin family)
MSRGIRMLKSLGTAGLVWLAASALAVMADEGGAARVRVTGAGDLFAAGGNVEISDQVPGDVFLAGGRVSLTKPVGGDAFIAGGNVRIADRLTDSLYVAAGSVAIEGDVGRHARGAGGDIVIASGANVNGKATFAGAHVQIDGRVGKALTAVADSVRINGQIDGDAEVSARSLEIGPKTVIGGKLTYWSAREAKIDPQAKIAGGVDYRAVAMPEGAYTAGIVALMIGKALFLIGLMILGSLLVLVFPNFTGVVERTFATNPGKSLLLGLALFVCLPLVGVLFMITILGIPIGITVFFLYPLVLMLGYLTAAFFIGDKGVAYLRKGRALTAGWRVAGVIAALLLLALLRALPVVGGLVVFGLLLAGMGAWAIALYQRYHTPRTAT